MPSRVGVREQKAVLGSGLVHQLSKMGLEIQVLWMATSLIRARFGADIATFDKERQQM